MVPADAVTGPEPGDCPPRVLGQPQEDAGDLGAGHGGGDGELNPRATAGILHHLLDHWHPLAAHPERGQHRVGALLGGRALGHPHRRQPPAADVPVPRAGPEPGQEVAQHRLLEARPGVIALAPAPERRRPVGPRAQPFHGVIERPAERALAHDVPAVPGHPPGHVGPARDDGQELAALDDGHPVALLEPQRAQGAGVQGRPAAGMLGVAGRHERRPAGFEPRQIGAGRRLLVIGDPRGGHDGIGVVQVGGGGGAVVLDHHPAAAVGALAVQQDSRLPGVRGRP